MGLALIHLHLKLCHSVKNKEIQVVHPSLVQNHLSNATGPNILEFGDELSISIKTSLRTLETTASFVPFTVIFLDCTVHNNLYQVNINNFGCYII